MLASSTVSGGFLHHGTVQDKELVADLMHSCISADLCISLVSRIKSRRCNVLWLGGPSAPCRRLPAASISPEKTGTDQSLGEARPDKDPRSCPQAAALAQTEDSSRPWKSQGSCWVPEVHPHLLLFHPPACVRPCMAQYKPQTQFLQLGSWNQPCKLAEVVFDGYPGKMFNRSAI